jgi:hypothetical protein
MGEIPRESFEVRLGNAPLAAIGFFENVIEHCAKRNSAQIKVVDLA